MREIKFRGKDQQGSWHIGYFVPGYMFDDNRMAEDTPFLVSPQMEKHVRVVAETVGQYTGLTDKNGAEIYQGDIVNCSSGCPHEIIWVEKHGGTFFGGMPAWYLSGIGEGYDWTGMEEKIGNVHDNPELLKGA